MINQIFKIRSCKYDINEITIAKKKYKLCLDYHINKCDGPCEGLISESEYNEMVQEVIKLLRGKTDDLINELEIKMQSASAELDFEKAAEIRDKLEQLKTISSKQKIVSNDFVDRDVLSVAYEGNISACSIFNIRSGKLVGKKQLQLRLKGAEELPEIFNSIVKFYYSEQTEIPKEILFEKEPIDSELLKAWLNLRAGKKVKFVIPQRGELRSLVKMCKQNAILQLKEIQIQKMKKEGHVPFAVAALQKDLGLNKLPAKIECFDISNLQGTDSVASMVVFVDGKPKKSLYRKFIIKDVDGPDDFASMQEVLKRRYTRLIKNEEPMPDLIMVDGGKGQLSSALEVLNDLGLKQIPIIGLAKRLEEVFFPKKSEALSISKTSSGLKLLQQIRDEAHRFAITFHRKRRNKRTFTSELTGIKGIGPSTAQMLIKQLGSVSKIKKESLENIAAVVGNKRAKIIFKYFQRE
jgi:excinuclease ABC subunit C